MTEVDPSPAAGAPHRPAEAPHRRLTSFLGALETDVRAVGPDAWALRLEAAGHRLDLLLAVRGPFLHAEAAVLPPGLIEPRQLLHWNRQAPLVCFAAGPGDEVIVCGELPLEGVGEETLDRFLGLLVASAGRAREFVTRPAR